MIKKFIASICLLSAIGTFAQEGTASPYSFYGIGEVKFKGSNENRAMGSLSIFPDSTHVNLQNPAGFAGLKFTTFSLGGSFTTTKLVTNTDDGKAQRTTVDYMAIGLPLGKKFGAGFGLIAYSSVGYKIQSQDNINVETNNRYSGTGGVNKVFFSLGYKINSNFSIGANADYHFGEIETSSLESLDPIQFGTRELNRSEVSGLGFNTGLMYSQKLKEKMSVFASLTYTPESRLNFGNERNIATVRISGSSDPTVVDQQDIDVADTKVTLPSRFAFGAGVGEERKWLVGAEMTFSQSGDLTNRFEDIDNATFENATRISVGGYFIPDYDSFSSYFKRITFRAGLRHENTGLILNGKSIEDTAATFGLGFPISGSLSNINVGIEYGKRGTKVANLVEENYLNFTLSLSLNDKWFVKKKYY